MNAENTAMWMACALSAAGSDAGRSPHQRGGHARVDGKTCDKCIDGIRVITGLVGIEPHAEEA
jgi:hypothetical protein